MKKSKPSIILIHGYRGTPLGMAAVKLALEKFGAKVYAPAIPPFGDSPELHDYTPIFYSDYLADYIKKNHLEGAILVGHSMGSIITATTISRYPRLVDEKVVFLSPIAKKAPRPITMLAPLATLLPNELVSFITTKYLFVPKNSRLFKKSLELTIRCGADCSSKQGSRAAAKFSSAYSIADFDFEKQALFLAGEKDRLNSKKQVQKVAAKYGAKAKFLKNAGHLCNYECPARVAREIATFIDLV